MNDLGVDVQVLSLSTPGVQILSPVDSVSVARDSNNALSELVMANPARFQALAAVPTPVPEAAADELERTVTRLGFRAPVPRAGAAKRSGEGGHRRWQLGAAGPGISVCQPARERCSYVSMVRG